MKNNATALVVIFLLIAVTMNGESNHGDPEDRKERDYMAKAQVAKEQKEKARDRQLAISYNAYKAARDTQAIIATVDKLIAETKNKIATLERSANLSVAMKNADRKREKAVAPNVKATASALKELFTSINKQVNPVAEAISKSKATKNAYDRVVETLSWDTGVVAALDAEATLTAERRKLEKLLISRATLLEYQTLMTGYAATAYSKANEIEKTISGGTTSSDSESHRDGTDRTKKSKSSHPKDKQKQSTPERLGPEIRWN